LPDISIIRAKWRAVIEDLGNLPKLATPPELDAARKSMQSLLGIVRVYRNGIGYADLSIGVPTNVVAGLAANAILRWSQPWMSPPGRAAACKGNSTFA
jgi:hypothetical protein